MVKNLSFLIITTIIMTSCTGNKIMSDNHQLYDIKEVVTDPNTTLIDVRIKEEFELNTVKGAINIPLKDLEKNLDLLKEKKNIVVFCNRGRQSDLAIDVLKKNGLNNVYDGTTWQNVRAIQQEQTKK